jgi:MFS family permease
MTTETHNKRYYWVAWGILLLGALFYFYEFLLQVSPSVMVPNLLHAFHVNGAQLGLMSSGYFYAYALIQIPAGVLIDRFGSRKLLAVACLICALGSLLFGLSDNFWLASFSRALTGVGSAFAVIGCMTLAAHWFGAKHFALLSGLIVSLGMLGAICGGAPLAYFVYHTSWQSSLLMLSGVGVVLALVLYLFIRDYPADQQAHFEAHYDETLSGLKSILKSKQSWLGAIYGSLMYAPTIAFAALWGVPSLVASHGLERHSAAFIVSLIFAGWAFGGPIFGWLSDHTGKRKPALVIANIAAFILFSLVIYLPAPVWVIGVLLFIYGFFLSGFLVVFSLVREINPMRYSATSIGFVNTLNMLGGAIAQPLIGKILDATDKSHTVIKHTVVYSAHSYAIALAVLPLLLLLATLCLPWIKESYCGSRRGD